MIGRREIYVKVLAILAFTTCILLSSCSKYEYEKKDKVFDDALLLYSAGFNNLSSFLQEDIKELSEGYIPTKKDSKLLLVWSHFPQRLGDYSKKMNPTLSRVYKNKNGEVIKEPVLIMDTLVPGIHPETIGKVCDFIKTNYKVKRYGLIFSSHATGYLPSGYFANPDKYESTKISQQSIKPVTEWMEYEAPYEDSDLPLTKTLGQESGRANGTTTSYEMDIKDFAKALTIKFDYIMMDVCLMGGIEVAYEFKDICNVLCVSPTEVLADGLNYKTLGGHLLGSMTPNFMAVSSDYIEHYKAKNGDNQSATWIVLDCTKLEPLAEICKTLFEKYRTNIKQINPNKVQPYFYNSSKHWHYDLMSILMNSGATDEELAEVEQALDGCTLFKDATDKFIGVPIKTYSGLSMMLPSNAGNYLKDYYKSLSWNKRTTLVK